MDANEEMYNNLLNLMLCVKMAEESQVNPLPTLRKAIIRVYQHTVDKTNRSNLLTLLAKENLIEEVSKEYERIKEIRTKQASTTEGVEGRGVCLPV